MLVTVARAAFADAITYNNTVCVVTKVNDTMTGTAMNNTIVGKNGGDTINYIQRPDEDTIRGNNTDFVNCGSGKDTVFIDNKGKVTGCEKMRKP
jgi:Ca2+-binding RTX toxin-like protein